MKGGTDNVQNFNPRSPQGGATRPSRPASCGKTFQSTLPARGSDEARARKMPDIVWISIHAPRKGERPSVPLAVTAFFKFQSTLPARGSDSKRGSESLSSIDFNPRSPQGGATVRRNARGRRRGYFNPRSPQGGATTSRASVTSTTRNFNPRSPQGGATLR